MKLPQELRYTKTQEWVRREADGTVDALGVIGAAAKAWSRQQA